MNNKKILLSILIGIILGFPSCKEQDKIYEKYVVPNGLTYPGKALNPVAHPGNECVEIRWQNNTDPKVVKASISWNNDTESVEFNIEPGADVIRRIIKPLVENTYSFMIRTYDVDNNVSVPVEVIGTVYGKNYVNSLLNRNILSLIAEISGKEIAYAVTWGKFDAANAKYSEITYIDSNGKNAILKVPIAESNTVISDMIPDGKFKFRTVYVPEMSIDTFYTDYKEYELPTKFYLNKSGWILEQFSDQVNTAAANVASNAIDGNVNNRWHSANTPYPHWLIIDLGEEVVVSHFGIWQSIVDVPAGDQRICSQFELYIRSDKPTIPDNNIGWTKIETFDCAIDIREQVFKIEYPVKGRYLKFVGTKGGSNANYLVLAELDVYVELE